MLFGNQGGSASLTKVKAALKKGYDYSGNKLFDNASFNKLLAGILEIDPEKRMSPEEILDCEYLNQQEFQ